MKKVLSISFVIAVFLSTISCGPTRHAIHLEMRYPSKSGLELVGKNLAVAYASTGDTNADLYNAKLSVAFAKALESDYGTGDGSVVLCEVDGKNGDYAHRDSLINILVKAGADLVFLFAPVEIQTKDSGAMPVKVSLHCYDAMNKEDKVFPYTGTTVLSSLHEETLVNEASDAGKIISQTFVSQWKHEQYSIAYYDSQKWYEALERAEQYDWKGAIDIWFTLLDSYDIMKRASAEYNIAVACFMMGDLELADKWLEKSKADNDMPTLTDALRKRIDARRN